MSAVSGNPCLVYGSASSGGKSGHRRAG